MRLDNLEFIKLLPQFMQNDAAVKGLAAGIDRLIPELAAEAELLSVWDHIDQLSAEELDELAWELNILWYDKSASIDTKRDLVKNSGKVYKRLGTKWAAENVIASYFGDGSIEEWFQYDGEPGHFRVASTNPTLTNEKLLEFMSILNKVKRATAKLDGIYFLLSGELTLSAGVAVHEIGHERYSIGVNL